MYVEYYGFAAMPFRLSPDARFFFGSQEHNKAMAFLQYGIAQGEGFVIVTGEVGAGKTTLIEQLLRTLDGHEYVIGRIVNTQLDSYEMIRMVTASFGIVHEGRDKSALILELKRLFESLQAAGKRALLIVDEAQSLTAEAVEELRMLSNLQGRGETAFQVILLGQPEFRLLVASPGFEQVRQRVTASCHLGPLDGPDTRAYVQHRLDQVGWNDDPHITEDAFEAIYRRTGGIPRRINSLCSRLLLLGFLDKKHLFDGDMVDAVAQELASEMGFAGQEDVPETEPASAEESPSPPRAAPAADTGLFERRFSRMERKLERHEFVIKRALNLASEHMSKAMVRDEPHAP